MLKRLKSLNTHLMRTGLICASLVVAAAALLPVYNAPAAPAGVQAAQTANTAFAAHKALYQIRLASAKSGAQVINISGDMFYEWQPSCDGWTSNNRFNLLYEYADAPTTQITSDFSTYETFDGKSLSFTSQSKQDGQVLDELRGSASIDAEGKGEAVYSKPRGLAFDLPAGTLFPMAHTVEMLKKIKEGKKFFNAVIFDGSDEDGPIEVNAFIGQPVPPESVLNPTPAINADLLKSPAHKVRLAFFPLNNPASIADYEMSMVVHENGLVSDMTIEYHDFSVTQKLVALEPVPSTCEPLKTYNK